MSQEPKKVFKIVIPPGLYRDYTQFSAMGVTDAKWFRFYHSRLKKMGGFQYIAGLNNYTVNSNYSAANFQQQGNPNTEPSYPQKQYLGQDLNQPYDANFNGYDTYNFTVNTTPATWNDNATSSTGYRVPRKIVNAVLDGINQLIITADYSQNISGSVIINGYGGIAFSGTEDNTQQTTLVDAVVPQLFRDGALIPGYRPNNTYTWSLDVVNLTLDYESSAMSTYIVDHPVHSV